MRKYTEENLQHECYIYAVNNYGLKHHNPRIIFASIPNEVAMMIRGIMIACGVPKRTVDTIISLVLKRMKNMGFHAGFSDCVIITRGTVIFCEFKLPGNYQQSNQKEFEKRITELGHEYVVIKSLEEFKKYLEVTI